MFAGAQINAQNVSRAIFDCRDRTVRGRGPEREHRAMPTRCTAPRPPNREVDVVLARHRINDPRWPLGPLAIRRLHCDAPYPIGRGKWSVAAMFCVSVRASLTVTWEIP